MQKELIHLAQQVGELLIQRGQWVSVAESCTGGWLAQVMTSIPGSSNWFDCGYVTYSNAAKMQCLGVQAPTLEHDGAVSERTVCEMSEGVIAKGRTDYAVAISGIAGPEGGLPNKPVGTVWIAWLAKEGSAVTRCFHFQGDRNEVRKQSVYQALEQLLLLIKSK